MSVTSNHAAALRHEPRFFRRWSRHKGPARVLGTITRASTREPVVALTFDDGPHPAATPRLLALLLAYRARATFFMLGIAAARHPALVRQVAEAGHAIANHSWDHPSFPNVSAATRRAQIEACERAIAPYGVRLFRPPYGDQDLASMLDVARMGYRVITWDVETGDWRREAPAVVAYRMTARTRPGSIVLLHDGDAGAREGQAVDRSTTLKALELALRRLREAYTFVTIPELLRRGRPRRALWLQRDGVPQEIRAWK